MILTESITASSIAILAVNCFFEIDESCKNNAIRGSPPEFAVAPTNPEANAPIW